MPRRKSIGIALTIAVAALVTVWSQRIEIVLGLLRLRTAHEIPIAPNHPVPWQQGPVEPAASGDRPPNIVLILADDLGINDVSTFGGGVAAGRVRTPNIDRLASEGAVFERAYAGAATCAPSRAMILTGRYPTRTGFEFTPTPGGMGPVVSMIGGAMDTGLPPILRNSAAAAAALPYAQQGLPGSELTLAEVLRDRGYHTVHIGKWHLGQSPGFAPNDQGFDESLLMANGLYLPVDDPGVVNAPLDFDPIDRFLWARMDFSTSYNSGEGERFRPGGYLTDYWTDESLKVIRANRNRPFFLYLAHWGVHSPLQATREDYDAVGDIKPHRLRVYAAMVRALDRSVGRVLEELQAQGLADNTVVIFSSDNGGAGYIGLNDINAPYRGWKMTMFEGGIRTPLLLRWPATIGPGTRLSEPVAHIDLMPTLAAASGARLPEGLPIDGKNLLPLATQPEATPEWSGRALFWQSGHYRVVRAGDWKLQVSARPDRQWLYDLSDDPTEQHNLADSRPDKLAELQALLDAHAATARAPLYPFTAEVPVAVDKPLSEPFEPGDEFVYWPN